MLEKIDDCSTLMRKTGEQMSIRRTLLESSDILSDLAPEEQDKYFEMLIERVTAAKVARKVQVPQQAPGFMPRRVSKAA